MYTSHVHTCTCTYTYELIHVSKTYSYTWYCGMSIRFGMGANRMGPWLTFYTVDTISMEFYSY